MEFVLVMPIVMMLLMLVLQFAQVWLIRQSVAYAAFCAARSLLSASTQEGKSKLNTRDNCAYEAARRVLGWVSLFGTQSSRPQRRYDLGRIAVDAEDFSDVRHAKNETYMAVVYGDEGTRDQKIPGWGQITESNSVDMRLNVRVSVVSGSHAQATVTYYCPLLMPIAGRMIGWLSRHSWRSSKTVRGPDLPPGWMEEDRDEDMFDGMPYIALTETGAVPLPYSTALLPAKAYDYRDFD